MKKENNSKNNKENNFKINRESNSHYISADDIVYHTDLGNSSKVVYLSIKIHLAVVLKE